MCINTGQNFESTRMSIADIVRKKIDQTIEIIDKLSDLQNLPEIVLNTAKENASKILSENMGVKRLDKLIVAVVSIYMASLKHGVGASINELCKISGVEKKKFSVGKRKILEILKNPRLPQVYRVNNVDKYCKTMGLSDEILEEIKTVRKKIEVEMQSKYPPTIDAISMYTVLREHPEVDWSVKKLCNTTGVQNTTLLKNTIRIKD